MYKIVSWDSRDLDGFHHMEPAGPLYSIECHEGSIRRLHLPHCETRTDVVTLSVAHVTGGNVEILQPLKDEMFECDYGPNYHPTFEVFLNTEVNEVTLSLLDENGLVVWRPCGVMLTGN
ncbi:hypothetical protein KOW79_021736 [Hemibagrus wyckioides]|uniref:FIIND domain-containing protein n=1 Tax=Hemibagrus wyckioides TaxID=337641 RepID=A0A9D3SC09_9TELE|nr:hypothetical protein KOW79_021736 [Hemibagrus wyckioides]